MMTPQELAAIRAEQAKSAEQYSWGYQDGNVGAEPASQSYAYGQGYTQGKLDREQFRKLGIQGYPL